MKIICIKHPKYKGGDSGLNLSCKYCCDVFVKFTQNQKESEMALSKWMVERAKSSERIYLGNIKVEFALSNDSK